MNAHWHIVHALVYIGLSCDDATRERRTEECIEFLVKDLNEKEKEK